MTEISTRFTADSNYAGSEAQFHLSEVFYSRTDKRGVIAAGNLIFQRVSGFDWPELIGAPHKLIRHPDMPKGVFQLVWDRLKEGHVTGVFIKNRCKNGRYYWVFAVIAPMGDGYVSTRVKPASEIMSKIARIYGELLEREQSEALTPRQAAEAFALALRTMGYANYDAFQSHAIASEFEARNKQLGHELHPLQRRFLDMSRAISQVHRETIEMTEAFKAIRTVPMNMRIIATRLENAGGPISAISVNYSQMLEEMSTWVDTFVDGEACVFARIRDAILKGQFLGFVAAIEQEMIETFAKEGQTKDAYPEGVNPASESEIVAELKKSFLSDTAEALADVEVEAKRFARSVLDMKRYVTGLSSTRMMCKIESAALSNSGTALTGIVEQLDACQNEIEQRLARVVELNSVIQSNTAMLRSLL